MMGDWETVASVFSIPFISDMRILWYHYTQIISQCARLPIHLFRSGIIHSAIHHPSIVVSSS